MTFPSKFRATTLALGLGVVALFIPITAIKAQQPAPPLPPAGTSQGTNQAANPPPVNFNSRFNGWFINVDIGSETNSVTSSYTTSGTGAATVTTTVNGSDSSGLAIVLDGGFMTTIVDHYMIGAGFAYQLQASDPAPYSGSIASNFANGDKYNALNNFSIYVAPAYAIDELTLIYGKGGFAQATYVTSTLRNAKATESGYVIGAGVKRFLSGRVYGLVEANYFSYSSNSATNSNVSGNNLSSNTGQDSFSAYNFLFGVGFRF
ncbi:MAG: hypothetical protein QM537_05800 [Candidatus Symbiobacter sp.]|nr:hypothetical protein [Candidatus Symbiobacter sp.]